MGRIMQNITTNQKLEKSSADKDQDVQNYIQRKIKIDRMLSIMLIILLAPLLAFIIILIKCSNWRAPVFFKQIRVGKQEKLFYIYKFRTMQVDAEALLEKYLQHNEVIGAMFKIKNDPRVTKLGKILRKTSLDELPQLWNVIKGDMALVGPRPPLVREVAEYTNYDKQRLLVTPGCTGMWQVSGRNHLSFAEMVDLDIYYIQHMSFCMDMKIICKTVKIVLFPKGAY